MSYAEHITRSPEGHMRNNCASDAECITWDDGNGWPVDAHDTDPVSGLCAECLLQRAKMAIDACTPEDEVRDTRALDLIIRALSGTSAVQLVEAVIRRENEKVTGSRAVAQAMKAVGL
jgi:hypothetical protein